MILAFPSNRIQLILGLLESDFIDRCWTALTDSAASVASKMGRSDAVLTLLEARRSYFSDIAERKFDLWMHAAQDCAGSGSSYVAELFETLQKVSQTTSRAATRQLYALVFIVLTALRMAGWISSARSRSRSVLRRVSAAQMFFDARLFAAIRIACAQREAPDIARVCTFTRLRLQLPPPRDFHTLFA